MASTKLKLLQTIVTADYSFNNFKIGDLAAPVNANDAARKAYVDTEVAKVAGAMTYKGTWDAAANAPAIPAAAAANKGHYYVVAAPGSTSVDGVSDWEQRDWIVSNGSVWEKIDNTDKVISVHGRTGAITAANGDYSAGLITFTPTGSLAATDVQAALAEVDGDVTALAGRITTAEGDVGPLQAAVSDLQAGLATKLNKALAAGRIFVGNGSGEAAAAKVVVRSAPAADGVFTVYTLADTPVSGTEQVFVNGLLLDVTDDYTIAGAAITFVSALSATDKVRVSYLALA